MPASLSTLSSSTAVTYLEHIARRGGSCERLRDRPWAVPEHQRILARLQQGAWISIADGNVRVRVDTIARLHRFCETLVLRLALRPGDDAAAADRLWAAEPIDARLLLPALAGAQRWSVFVAVAQDRVANADVAEHLGVCHSLVSYHVRHLAEAQLVERGRRRGLRINPGAAAELWEFFRLLEYGWPYRPGAVAPAPALTLKTRIAGLERA